MIESEKDEEENTNTQNKSEKTPCSETTYGVSETRDSEAEPFVKAENKPDESWTCDGEAEHTALDKYNQDYFTRVRTSVLNFEEHHMVIEIFYFLITLLNTMTPHY